MLRDPGRGAGEVQLRGDRYEMCQLPELHQSMISMLTSESNCWTDARGFAETARTATRNTSKEPRYHVLDTCRPPVPACAGAR